MSMILYIHYLIDKDNLRRCVALAYMYAYIIYNNIYKYKKCNNTWVGLEIVSRICNKEIKTKIYQNEKSTIKLLASKEN